jgi:chemotaxis protein MotB
MDFARLRLAARFACPMNSARLRLAARFACAALLPLVLAACVTRGTYRELEAERDAISLDNAKLEERVELLEASTESLGAERVQLIDEMETLREAHAVLDRDVNGLRTAKAELTDSLQAREAELAARRQEVEQLRGTYEGLVSDLESEVAAGQIEISQLRQGLQLNLTQDVLFASGSPELNDAGRSVLRKVAQRLQEVPHRVEVRGHTDSVPIRGGLAARYPSNWELAGARASGVVRFLAERKIDPRRLVSVSLGEYEPIASNDTADGRQKNRRIEIMLEPTRVEPEAATPPAKPAPPEASATP